MSRSRRDTINGIALIAVATAVLAAVVGGILLLDSPAQERLRRLDERRISDLRELSVAIDTYWTREGILPVSLEHLADDVRFLEELVDPETGKSYEYRVLGESTYELCAQFSRESAVDVRNTPFRAFWRHGPGRSCFEVTAQNTDRPVDR